MMSVGSVRFAFEYPKVPSSFILAEDSMNRPVLMSFVERKIGTFGRFLCWTSSNAGILVVPTFKKVKVRKCAGWNELPYQPTGSAMSLWHLSGVFFMISGGRAAPLSAQPCIS